MMPVREEDEPQGIHDMVNSIPAVAEFERESVPVPHSHLSSQRIKRHLRKFMTFTHGPAWFRCTIQEHTMPESGQRVFTVSTRYPKYGHIETFVVVVDADGGLMFAAPVEGD